MIHRPLIIIPTYNEVDNVDSLARDIFKFVPNASLCFVDDNSTDGTRKVIHSLIKEFSTEAQDTSHTKISIIERPGKMGLGSAYITGFKWGLARSFDAMIEMDADHSHSPSDLPKMLMCLEKNDVVIGSRYVPGGGTVNWSPIRKLISRFGSSYGRTILGMKINDFTGGFNGWRRKVMETIPLNHIKSEGYSFQIELKYRAFQFGFKLFEMPIIFTERRAGQSKMSSKIIIEAIWRVWQLRNTRL